jgi:hypothetical protein
MNNQEIIDNAPKGAAEVCFIGGEAIYNIYPFKPIRSLADIKRIVELEKALDKLIDRAQQVDSWESFPESWIDEAYEALKEPKT